MGLHEPALQDGLEGRIVSVVRGLLDRELRVARLDGDGGDLVLKRRLLERVPADGGLSDARGMSERPGGRGRRSGGGGTDGALLAARSGLRKGEQTAW